MAKKQVVLDVLADLRAWLEAKAKGEDRSLNQIATRALEQAHHDSRKEAA